MKLHLPVFTKWLNERSTLEKCRLCNAFALDAVRPDGKRKHTIYLRCECRTLPKFLLTRVNLEESPPALDLKEILYEWVKAKRNSWNKVVRYLTVSTKNW